jgi:hypothetical protein
MYNTSFTCTYQNEVNEADGDLLYQIDYLHIFQRDDFDKYEKEINACIREIYVKIEASQQIDKFKECMKLAASHFLSEDMELGLMALFSYDFLYLTHPCLIDFLKNGNMSEKNVSNLLERLGNR